MSDMNRVTWWEIPVADLAVAKNFYGSVFGWAFQPLGENYAAVFTEGDMIGGLDGNDADAAERGVHLYVNVEDLGVTLRRVAEAGGNVAHDPEAIGGDMGWWAAFTDPGGRWIGICSAGAPKGEVG